MYKESEVNLDDIVKALLESELGFLLLQSDNNCKNMYDVLSEKSTYEDRIGMFGYNTHITYHLFPLTYHTQFIIYSLVGRIKDITNITQKTHLLVKRLSNILKN